MQLKIHPCLSMRVFLTLNYYVVFIFQKMLDPLSDFFFSYSSENISAKLPAVLFPHYQHLAQSTGVMVIILNSLFRTDRNQILHTFVGDNGYKNYKTVG